MFLWYGWPTKGVLSSRDHCQRSSPSRIPDTPPAGFEPAQNFSSDLVERNCTVTYNEWDIPFHFQHIEDFVYTAKLLDWEGPWIFISTIRCFNQADKHFKYKQWFHDVQGANFIVTRNNFGHVLICYWLILFLTVVYWDQVVEFW